jgi:hypothetical protein
MLELVTLLYEYIMLMNNYVLKSLLIALLALSLTACIFKPGGKSPSAEQAKTDITRPPEFVKRGNDNVEGDPDVVVSYDEWKKAQDNKQDDE